MDSQFIPYAGQEPEAYRHISDTTEYGPGEVVKYPDVTAKKTEGHNKTEEHNTSEGTQTSRQGRYGESYA